MDHKQNLELTAPWYGPVDFSQWLRRLMSLRSVGLLLVMAALVLSELHYGWLEQLIGNYLISTNADRPKSGSIWEQGSQMDQARDTLDQFSSQSQNSQLEARRATSLAQVLASIVDEKGAMISADHFLELFMKLPPAIANEIVSPYLLLAKRSDDRWMRTYFEKQESGVLIYLLDSQNQVLDRITVGKELLGYIERGEVAVSMSLDRLADFAGHIYSADKFFNVLNSLTADARSGILARPEDLLQISGRIRRVGISELVQSDKVDLGFEVEDVDGPEKRRH